jgi:hypothetical protein
MGRAGLHPAHVEPCAVMATSAPSSEGRMDSWPLVISFSAVAALIFAYSFLIAT